MIKILMCSSSRKEKGGMNSVINQLMEHQWHEEFQISYLATHISGNRMKKILFFWRAYLRLYWLLKKSSFDFIHIHMSYKGSFYRKYYVAKLCKRYNKKVILHLHGSEFKDFYHSGSKALKQRILKLFSIVDCVIVLGEDWKHFILSIEPNTHVQVIHNAVALPKYKKRKRQEKPVFLFLGALIKRKGVIDLLTAANQLVLSGMDQFEIQIAGSGKEETRLKQYCKEHELDQNVTFLGWVSNHQKRELFLKSDVLVLPSYNEGLPVAILEALAYGLPVISTDIGSVGEAVISGENGYLYPPGNVELLEQYLKNMIQDKEQWLIFSEKARMIAENKFSEDKFFQKIERIYFDMAK